MTQESTDKHIAVDQALNTIRESYLAVRQEVLAVQSDVRNVIKDSDRTRSEIQLLREEFKEHAHSLSQSLLGSLTGGQGLISKNEEHDRRLTKIEDNYDWIKKTLFVIIAGIILTAIFASIGIPQ